MKKFAFIFTAAFFAVSSLPLQAEDVTVEEFPYECVLVPSVNDPALPQTEGVTEWWNTFAAFYARPALCGIDKDVIRAYSPVFHFNKKYKTFVITVTHTAMGYMNTDGDGPWFMLDEFYVLDAEGNRMELTADNFSTNALYSGSSMGTLIDCKEDETYATTFQTTAWEDAQPERGNHFLAIELPQPTDVIQFAFENRWSEWGASVLPTSFNLTVRSDFDQIWSNIQNAIVEVEAMGFSEENETDVPDALVFALLDALKAAKEATQDYAEDELEQLYNDLIAARDAVNNWQSTWADYVAVIAKSAKINYKLDQFDAGSTADFISAYAAAQEISVTDDIETIAAATQTLKDALNSLIPISSDDVTISQFPYECILIPSEDSPIYAHTGSVNGWAELFADNYYYPALCGYDKEVFRVYTPVFHFNKKYKTFVITVTNTMVGYHNNDLPGDGPWFMIDEFYVLDGEGNRIELTADNFSTNALYSGSTLNGLIDNNLSEAFVNLFQSTAWEDPQPERGNHYLVIELPQSTDVIQFAFENRWNEWGATTMVTSFDLSVRSNMEQLWSNLQRAIGEAEALGVSEDDTELPEDLVFAFLDALDVSKELTQECGEEEIEEMYNYLVTSTSALKAWMDAWYGLQKSITDVEAMNITMGTEWGQFTEESATSLLQALEDGKSISQYDDAETIAAAYDALLVSISALVVVKPEIGEYFYLYNTGTEGYLYATYSNLTGPGAVNCGWYCRTDAWDQLPMSTEYIWSLQPGYGSNIRLTNTFVDMAYGWTSINNDCEIYTGGSDYTLIGAGNELFHLFSLVPGTADSYMGICEWNNRSVGVYKDAPNAKWSLIPVDTTTVKELNDMRAVAPKAGLVFTIWNALQGDPDNRAYLYEDAEAHALHWEAIPYTPRSSKYMWTYEMDEYGTFRIKNLKTGNYIDNLEVASNATLSQSSEAVFAMTSIWANWTPVFSSEGCKFTFKDNNGIALKAVAADQDGVCNVEGAAYDDTDMAQHWFTTSVPAYACTIAANGYGSFYADYDVIVPEGVTAYYAEIDESNDRIILNETTDGMVKAGNGVVVKGAEGCCYFRLANGAAQPEFGDASHQVLSGTATVQTTTDITADNVYVVATDGTDLAFTILEAGTSIEAHQAFFTSTKNTTFTAEGANSISQIVECGANIVAYDICGRQVTLPQAGMYIINGKKVIVK